MPTSKHEHPKILDNASHCRESESMPPPTSQLPPLPAPAPPASVPVMIPTKRRSSLKPTRRSSIASLVSLVGSDDGYYSSTPPSSPKSVRFNEKLNETHLTHAPEVYSRKSIEVSDLSQTEISEIRQMRQNFHRITQFLYNQREEREWILVSTLAQLQLQQKQQFQQQQQQQYHHQQQLYQNLECYAFNQQQPHQPPTIPYHNENYQTHRRSREYHHPVTYAIDDQNPIYHASQPEIFATSWM